VKIPENIKDTYEFLKTVGAFAGLGVLLKWFWKLYMNRLTRREKELLVAAGEGDGSILLLKLPGMGRQWIRAGNLDLGTEQIPEVEFIDALDKLAARGLVRWVSGDAYSLTGSGIKLSKIYGRSIPVAAIPCEQNSTATKS